LRENWIEENLRNYWENKWEIIEKIWEEDERNEMKNWEIIEKWDVSYCLYFMMMSELRKMRKRDEIKYISFIFFKQKIDKILWCYKTIYDKLPRFFKSHFIFPIYRNFKFKIRYEVWEILFLIILKIEIWDWDWKENNDKEKEIYIIKWESQSQK